MKVGTHGNDPAPGFLVFFGVPDLDKAMSDVVNLGGSIEAPTEEPGFGRFCMCVDLRAEIRTAPATNQRGLIDGHPDREWITAHPEVGLFGVKLPGNARRRYLTERPWIDPP